MTTVTALEAKTRFGELLDRISRGEEVVITRHGKPVARIIPQGSPGVETIRRAVADLRGLRRKIAKRKGFKPLTDKEIRSTKNEGSSMTTVLWRTP